MENLQTPLKFIILVGYLAAFFCYCISFASNKEGVKRAAGLITLFTFLVNTALLGLRTVLTGTLPLSNLFEFGLFFLWGIVLVFLYVDYKYAMSGVGIFVLPIAISLLIWLLSLDNTIRPMMPALRSNWLFIHVLSAVFSYGAFAVSFALAVMFLFKEWMTEGNPNHPISKALPSLELLDDISYKVIFLGMPFLTIMLVTGAVWAEYSWGRYWSWDPKETWALITWFIYAAYLHVRLMSGWKGRKAAYLSILGFAAVLFTFIGVSFLLPGIHSYV